MRPGARGPRRPGPTAAGGCSPRRPGARLGKEESGSHREEEQEPGAACRRRPGRGPGGRKRNPLPGLRRRPSARPVLAASRPLLLYIHLPPSLCRPPLSAPSCPCLGGLRPVSPALCPLRLSPAPPASRGAAWVLRVLPCSSVQHCSVTRGHQQTAPLKPAAPVKSDHQV